jgi:NitT/TauT family transport system substrate-binding protein
MRAIVLSIFTAVFALSLVAPAVAEVNEVRITRQPGLVYLPLMVMEENKLIEKQAQKRGLGDIKVDWVVFNSGGAAVDALLSGNVDFVTSGGTNLLVAWSGSGGQVKGVGGAGAIPMMLVTRNPAVKSIKDLSDKDKIAVPTVRVSTQSTILAMASEQTFGPDAIHKFDPITLALGHPDALIALQSGKGEIDSHFSLPPFQDEELKIPGVHAILNSVDVAGGPVSNGVTFSSVKFHDANPKVFAAVHAALGEAIDLINHNRRAAAQIYLDQSHDTRLTVDDIVKIISQPNFVYSLAPQRTMKLADIMYRGGTIKMKATSWHDFFFQEDWNTPGS